MTDFTGKIVGALGISGPIWRLSNQALQGRAKIVQAAATFCRPNSAPAPDPLSRLDRPRPGCSLEARAFSAVEIAPRLGYTNAARRFMQHEKEQVALTSIAASAALTVDQGAVGIATGSLAILSEAGHSLIDLGATVMTFLAVRVSGKPADAEHHYGHGKVESVSALAETALLFLLSGVVIWEALKRLIEHEQHAVIANTWAFGVIAVSVAIDFFRSRALSRAAKEHQSQALEADALHFSSDLWGSLAVIVGLLGVRFGLWWAGGFDRRIGCGNSDLRRRLAARPPHHRDTDRHRAGRCRRGDHHRGR